MHLFVQPPNVHTFPLVPMCAVIKSCTTCLLVKMISELVQMVQTLALGYMHSNRHCDKRGCDAKTMLHAAGSVRHILVDVNEEGPHANKFMVQCT